MTAPDAIFTTNDAQVGLNNFQPTLAARFNLPELRNAKQPWIIIAKAVIGNGDGDPQNAGAELLLDDKVIDADNIRIYGGESQTVTLQAAVQPQVGAQAPLVEVKCQTFQGSVTMTKLIAFTVNTLRHAQ